jgi:cyclic-di-GMP-binding protein
MQSSSPPVHQPVVADLKSCEAWLARAALADPKQACRELTGLLESFEDASPPESALIEVLERLREPIVVAQNEHAKKFAARPLPLKDQETAALEQLQDLWTTLGRAYRRLLDAAVDHPTPEIADKQALLLQRALDCVAAIIYANFSARREIDAELWRDLHQIYRTAEQLGVSLKTVSAGFRSRSVSTCTEVYVRALLLTLANPYGLNARELAWARRWATMWAYKVDLATPTAEASGYAVDLAASQAPMWIDGQAATSTMRLLETSNLRRSIRARLSKLDSGIDPQTLGLGKDCVQPDVGRLLRHLLRAWVEVPVARQFTRRLATERTELTAGLEAIHLAVSGKAFKRAARHWDYTRRDAEQIHIYQDVAAGGSEGGSLTGFAAEKWETLDESANGFRLRRRGAGERLALAQLLGLKPPGARGFILNEVRWLMSGVDHSLTIGAIALPGLAQGVAVRPASAPNQAPEAYVQGFLPNAAAQPTSMVLPSGWFQPGREIEVRDDEQVTTRVVLTALLQRGHDFDRASFSTVSPASG